MRRIRLCCLCGMLTVVSSGSIARADGGLPPPKTPYVMAALDLNDFANGRPSAFIRNDYDPLGPLSIEASTSTSSGSVYASLGLLRFSSTSRDPGTSEGQAYFIDRMTIVPNDPSLVGRPGRLLASVEIKLSGGGATTSTPIGEVQYLWSRWHGTVGANALMSGFELWQEWKAAPAGGIEVYGDSPAVLPVWFDFTFGQPLIFGASGSVETHVDTGGFQASATVDSFSLRWMGFTDVLDDQGRNITGYSVRSDSGIDWSVAAIPEPEVGAGLFIAVLSLVRRRR